MSAPRQVRDPLEYERGCGERGLHRVAGVDEVGRGPLAGPVVAAAVILGSGVEIEGANILRATARAMNRALARLAIAPDHVVVDGLPVRDLDWEHEAVVGGDAIVHSIACASIVAKVCRDRLMTRLAARYPEYGWERNMGYATRQHRDAVRSCGLTPHHRSSFGLLQLELPFADDSTAG